jgi:outer membrane protein assembly factor BamB
VIKGKVIIGNGGAEMGVRGYVSAYDAETGKMVWRFYTVPGDPSKPFENAILEKAAKTWSGSTLRRTRCAELRRATASRVFRKLPGSSRMCFSTR